MTELTEAVLEQARQGRVLSISLPVSPRRGTEPPWSLAPAVARRVVPELLGAGCSLLDFSTLMLGGVKFDNTWASTFGKGVMSSAVLRTLRLECCGLQGPLPEMRLPALQELNLNGNQLSGGLEPLQNCTALQHLSSCQAII